MTKDEVRAYNAAYYAKNRDARLASFRIWKEENRDAHRALSAEWQKNNPEKSAALKAAYKKRNPEKVRQASKRKTASALGAHAARQTARNRALARPDAEVTAFYVACAQPVSLPCFWCGALTGPEGRHVDHILPVLPDQFRARRTS